MDLHRTMSSNHQHGMTTLSSGNQAVTTKSDMVCREKPAQRAPAKITQDRGAKKAEPGSVFFHRSAECQPTAITYAQVHIAGIMTFS